MGISIVVSFQEKKTIATTLFVFLPHCRISSTGKMHHNNQIGSQYPTQSYWFILTDSSVSNLYSEAGAELGGLKPPYPMNSMKIRGEEEGEEEKRRERRRRKGGGRKKRRKQPPCR
jgi:hypothetical protein